jgi:hypothetical protein
MTTERQYVTDDDQSYRLGHISHLAVLDKAERDAIPDDCATNHSLRVVLHDRLTGQRHESLICAVCESVEFFDGEDLSEGWTLQRHFYRFHFCPCHRGDHAGVDCECEHGRWLVESITCDAMPGVVLYREEWN